MFLSVNLRDEPRTGQSFFPLLLRRGLGTTRTVSGGIYPSLPRFYGNKKNFFPTVNEVGSRTKVRTINPTVVS